MLNILGGFLTIVSLPWQDCQRSEAFFKVNDQASNEMTESNQLTEIKFQGKSCWTCLTLFLIAVPHPLKLTSAVSFHSNCARNHCTSHPQMSEPEPLVVSGDLFGKVFQFPLEALVGRLSTCIIKSHDDFCSRIMDYLYDEWSGKAAEDMLNIGEQQAFWVENVLLKEEMAMVSSEIFHKLQRQFKDELHGFSISIARHYEGHVNLLMSDEFTAALNLALPHPRQNTLDIQWKVIFAVRKCRNANLNSLMKSGICFNQTAQDLTIDRGMWQVINDSTSAFYRKIETALNDAENAVVAQINATWEDDRILALMDRLNIT